jgi:uncharacterized protein with HEPN domain
MPRSLALYLEDILTATGHIQRVSQNRTKSEFFTNEDAAFVAERNFINIGEALTLMKRNFPAAFAEVPHGDRIIGFRNVLVHAYSAVDPETVWSIIRSDLEPLRTSVLALEKKQADSA